MSSILENEIYMNAFEDVFNDKDIGEQIEGVSNSKILLIGIIEELFYTFFDENESNEELFIKILDLENEFKAQGALKRVIKHCAEEIYKSPMSDENKGEYLNILSSNSLIAIDRLARLSTLAFNKFSSTISLKEILKLADESERIRSLMFDYENSDRDFSNPFEVCEYFEYVKKEFLKGLDEVSNDNKVKVLIKSKSVNLDQLVQCFLFVGSKPTLDGNILPGYFRSSYLTGMKTIEDFFISATGARKALVTNYEKVRSSGYMSRKIMLLLSKISFKESSLDINDSKSCIESSNKFIVHIKDEEDYGKFSNRYLLDNGKIRLVNENDIGKTIKIFSPLFCKAEEGICPLCFGKNLLWFKKKEVHAGMYGSIKLSEMITQRLLSSKHLLKPQISMNNGIYNFMRMQFSRKGIDIIPSQDLKLEFSNVHIDEFKESFKLGKCKCELEVSEDEIYEIDFSNVIIKVNKCKYKVHGTTVTVYLTKDTPLPALVVNTDVSGALENIFNVLETKDNDALDLYESIMLPLKLNGLFIQSIYIELIIRALMIKPGESTLTNSLTNSIIYNESPTLSISFERVKRQINSPNIYTKSGKSIFDGFYK